MKLKHIKLAGFKSFVEPTVITVPSHRVAVVGPNGCGKSNIIDAIRWVIGESPRELRAATKEDVIFNGSIHRKPVGQAFVELLFDNSDASLGGEYAKYSEISVKRLVTRDGQSNYFINNVRCRRRDVADIFLGTGLGPNCYAVIGQGMTSDFAEASPEKMREYIEEAANVSKYKKRRRDTEISMTHTRENLDRINDVREEQNKLVAHLDRQAQAAEKYKKFRAEERELRSQILAMQWQELQKKLEKQESQIREKQMLLATEQEKLNYLQVAQEQQRLKQTEKHEGLHAVQDRFYRQNAEISKLEEQLKHQHEKAQSLREALANAEQQMQKAQETLSHDQDRVRALDHGIQDLSPRLEQIQNELAERQSALRDSEMAMRAWQTAWDSIQQTTHQAMQKAQVEQTRIQHLEQNYQETQKRVEHIQKEQAHQEFEALERALMDLESLVKQSGEATRLQEQRLADSIQEIQTHRSAHQNQARDLDALRQQQHQERKNMASIEALQQVALGKQDSDVVSWLQQHKLDGHPRLAQELQVETGWEDAVETVLGDYLQAVCSENVDAILPALNHLNHGNMTLLGISDNAGTTASYSTKEPTLLQKITTGVPAIASLLAHVYFAEDVTVAMAMLKDFDAQESVVTRDGIWLGKGWVRVRRAESPQQHVLQRENELKQLQQHLETTTRKIAVQEAAMEASRQTLQNLEEAREQQQSLCNQAKAKQSDCQAQYRVKQAQLEQIKQQAQKLTQNLQDSQERLNQLEAELKSARHLWQEALRESEDQSGRRSELQQQREGLQEALSKQRQATQELQAQKHQMELQLQSHTTQKQSLEVQMERAQQMAADHHKRQEVLQEAIEAAIRPVPALEQDLQNALSLRIEAEEALKAARLVIEALEHEFQELSQSRQQAERTVAALQSELEQLNLDANTWRVQQSGHQEQLATLEVSLEGAVQSIVPDTSLEALTQQLERVEQSIRRLGAINLAAIDEYQVALERKNYLDAQYEDLTTALTALDEAIQKIDKETKVRFKEVFDTVNGHFKHFFPKLFGGGHAELLLTSEDLLTSGVTLIARPPGKRNSTIHLLSGGEKTLTAIALVFSIFQLNPAPFCLLDEVDAPLDDANVVRFCQLVEEMSQAVQFMFITHNKLTMEIADHLIGITMNEPGVSRPVSVSMEKALEMAAA